MLADDWIAISQLQSTYARALDTPDIDAAAALFDDDAVWTGGTTPVTLTGRREIRAGLASMVLAAQGGDETRSNPTTHVMGNPVIAVNGDEATATFTLVTLRHPLDGGESPLRASGTYRIGLVRRSGNWRFASMHLDLHWVKPSVPGRTLSDGTGVIGHSGELHQSIAVVRSYFALADAHDPAVLDLFHDDVEFYFPRFGVGYGKKALAAMIQGFRAGIDRLEHRREEFTLTVQHDRVVVEGTTEGSIGGTSWSGGRTRGGRFCSVFQIRAGLIARMYIYLDPDYLGQQDSTFRWAKGISQHW
jgi:uncharacterized protein (TIGR02246 family)